MSKFNQNYLLQLTPKIKDLKLLNEANKSSLNSQGISKTKMFLITLSTTIMLAKKKELPKEYYQWTRAYLETIRNDDGSSLPNVTGLLNHIDWFENHNIITDELQNSREKIPSNEQIEIKITDVDEESMNISDNPPMLSSTGLSNVERNQVQFDLQSDSQEKLISSQLSSENLSTSNDL